MNRFRDSESMKMSYTREVARSITEPNGRTFTVVVRERIDVEAPTPQQGLQVIQEFRRSSREGLPSRDRTERLANLQPSPEELREKRREEFRREGLPSRDRTERLANLQPSPEELREKRREEFQRRLKQRDLPHHPWDRT